MHETREQVLSAIADGPVSGPDIASRLDVSRAAVWKHVEALREAGFTITSEDDGYLLSGVPDFGGPAVAYELDAPFEIEYHDAIPSTNARARELAGEGATDVVVLADEQTGGRGRLDRTWHSPSGGIWLSVLFRPDVPMAGTPVFTLAAAVAVTRAAREAGVEAVIKWPNDVLVEVDGEERKLVGILTEMEGEADRVSWVVVGIGINANVDPDDLPSEADAMSLSAIRGEPVDRRRFTQRVLETFDTVGTDPEAILDEWREYASTLGREVRIDTPDGEVVGEAVDIEYPGSLVVDTGEERVTVAAGDCDHLRPL
ncbi:biotin--[acetyl-CoA-carboxylase] ligase [Haloarcula salinisoli]|uniref:Biotin--[acetyl-CoA-carboxylase] ligase n=1 Tax=Haloarcula salinisoli TaxID=2487746 RepID=A0A8J8C7M6_9EURY|nr:biotin--[acetyl-CoA-carboxylase] ligase [Halomicroarcula salinisoli]MBX0285001.1 biotin--[acetyl-CoA-carboxylase] ligase [Halomicroarcula salinisoli]MBX0303521.1 biotin--[acetyl-CoA-carboxylase] ligase [Halomicroarcula salinisoli]